MIHHGQLQYVRHLGAYKPRFQGRRIDYYPTTWFDIVVGMSMVLFLIGCWVALTVAMVYWARSLGSSNFSLGTSLAAIIFSGILVIGSFFGSRRKDKRQAMIMREAIAKQKQIYNPKKKQYFDTESELHLKFQQNEIRLEING